MIQNDEDVKYSRIVKSLNSCQKINAPSHFEADLMRRINSGIYEEKRETFWDQLLLPSRLIPVSVVLISTLFLLFFFNLQTTISEDPLTIDPRVREDFLVTEGTLNKPPEKDKDSVVNTRIYVSSASNRDLFINKSGLNFRQVKINDGERAKINQLKANLQKIWSGQGSK